MKLSINQDISFYQLAFNSSVSLESVSLSPGTILAFFRAQIDVLIEQKIPATLLVKLPPGEIWHQELVRYKSAEIEHNMIYSFYLGEKAQEHKICNFPCRCMNIQLLANNLLCREYFLVILSPQFCSLILVARFKHHLLSTINTFDGKIIQKIVAAIQQVTKNQCLATLNTEFIGYTIPNSDLLNLLVNKQLQHQEKINQQTQNKYKSRLNKYQQNIYDQENYTDEYLASVCQELRTPLTNMKTALSLLNSPHLKGFQRQRYLQMLNQQCDRQNSLINGLIDLVELEENLENIKLETVHLPQIIPGLISIYQTVAQEKEVKLNCHLEPNLPAVWCVAGKIRQIIINLLHNSIKFTPEGGQVWVRSRVNGNYVQLEFQDTGIGIPEVEIPKIFNRFYRVRTGLNDGQGAGLGLTIVKQLLQRSGGTISVRSKPEQGSIFIVSLPLITTKPKHSTII
ncbi:MAG TPA: ATP-binding protein [Nostocaceae cyanobacterium]|nr:ATP-binding protein [Nostocaceae cyanobacterium]